MGQNGLVSRIDLKPDHFALRRSPNTYAKVITGENNFAETGTKRAHPSWLPSAYSLDGGPDSVSIGAKTVQNRASKTCFLRKVWVDVQWVVVSVEAIEKCLVYIGRLPCIQKGLRLTNNIGDRFSLTTRAAESALVDAHDRP